MKILLLGASGRTGRHIATGLVAEGHDVVSLGRRGPDLRGVDHRAGDPADAAALAAALDGAEAVVSALASSNSDPVCSRAATALVEVAEGRPLRFVTIGGAGVDVPGDSKGFADRAVGAVMRLVVGRMLADRQSEYGLLAALPLRWTILRPPRLVDTEGTGRFTLSFDRPRGTKIARRDLALAAVEAVGRDDLAGRAPFVAEAAT